MSEQKLQKKILTYLKDGGCYVIKVVVGNRKGIPDIIGCLPNGRFFAIEVKVGSNKTSRLQDYNIDEVRKRKGIAFVAYNLDKVKEELDEYLKEST